MRDSLTLGIRKFAGALPDVFQQAGTSAGLAVLEDAVHEEPTPPIKDGHLRGSGWARVNGAVVEGTAPPGSPPESGRVRIEVGFGTPYAAYQHQGLEPGPGVTHPTSGRFVHLQPGPVSRQAGDVGGLFLSTKLDRNRARYARIFAARMRRLFGGGS